MSLRVLIQSLLFSALAVALSASVGFAQPASMDWGSLAGTTRPTELTKAEITEKKGDFIPTNIGFVDDEGNNVTMGDYLGKGKPIILQLGYFECPLLCGTVHKDMINAFRGLDIDMADFYVLSVSINPDESWRLANLKRRSLTEALLDRSSENWRLLTGKQFDITELTRIVGFGYAYIPETGEYAHPAGLVFIAADGKITQYLGGLKYKPEEVRKALVEAGRGSVGTPLEQLWLTCANMVGRLIWPLFLLRIGATLTILTILSFFFIMWVKMMKQKQRDRDSAGQDPLPTV